MFSHLQQQKMQIKKPMMRSAAATDSVMIKIWKFTAFHNIKKEERQTDVHVMQNLLI